MRPTLLAEGAVLVAAALLSACASSDVTVRPVTGPSGDTAFAITCEKGPEICEAEAKRLCPKGHRTLEPGKGGWYRPELGPTHASAEQRPGDLYRQYDWVIACD